METTIEQKRLTHLVACAGCAAKIGPALLTNVLSNLKIPTDERLIVGLVTGDDAGVYKISEDVAIVQTLDFFTPIVDDPYVYGQIAAANALSDVYAMGGRPLTAMNIVCFPIGDRDINELGEILRGGAEKISEAGASLVGGHSIDDPAPKYGLSVTGIVDPNHIATNAAAQPGDVVILTKPLGTGIVTTASKFDECDKETLDQAIASMTTLNVAAAEAMRRIGIKAGGVHAATDITGFSLLGHLYHLARASGVRIELKAGSLPLLPRVDELAEKGNVTKGGRNNGKYLSEAVTFSEDISENRRNVMLDPQTSGGLAICVAEERADEMLDLLAELGVKTRAVIGGVRAGNPGISVTM